MGDKTSLVRLDRGVSGRRTSGTDRSRVSWKKCAMCHDGRRGGARERLKKRNVGSAGSACRRAVMSATQRRQAGDGGAIEVSWWSLMLGDHREAATAATMAAAVLGATSGRDGGDRMLRRRGRLERTVGGGRRWWAVDAP